MTAISVGSFLQFHLARRIDGSPTCRKLNAASSQTPHIPRFCSRRPLSGSTSSHKNLLGIFFVVQHDHDRGPGEKETRL
jgi:hypothetical protein